MLEVSTPKELEPYENLWLAENKANDELMWQMGLYIERAVSVAIDHSFNGDKAKSKYFETPIYKQAIEEMQLTQEEIDNRAIQKMLANEKAWQINDELRGLPTADKQNKATD